MVRCFTLCVLLLYGIYGYSQLSDFTLTVTVTDETCFGNGSLAFSVSGTEPGATMMYEVYKLPNTATPVATSTGNPVTGLISGIYNVIAIQSSEDDIGTQEIEVTIADLTNPLSYVVQSYMICPNEGSITINVLTGTAATYEIISGPNNFSAPPQDSNIFTGLEPGLYQVGVQDGGPCGDFFTQDHQILYEPLQPIGFGIIDMFPNLTSCTEGTVTIAHELHLNGNVFPITAIFTTYPPDGSEPVVQTQIITETLSFYAIEDIPFYDGEYFYDIEIIDVCGNSVSLTDLPVMFNLGVGGNYDYSSCYSIVLTAEYFVESYTITFDTYPPGFDPELFNANHPGPFTELQTFYGLDTTGELLVGDYEVTITDSCGRTGEGAFTIGFPDQEPLLNFFKFPPIPPECECEGEMLILHIFDLESVVLIDAPEIYKDYLAEQNISLPYDISAYIPGDPANSLGGLYVIGCGEYTVLVTDICGKEFLVTEEKEPFIPPDHSFYAQHSPGCDGLGSVRIVTGLNPWTGNIEGIYILDAPDEFYELVEGAIPGEIYDISDHVYLGFPNNEWYIGISGLPPGDYELDIQVSCHPSPFNFTVEAYQEVTTIDIEEMCGMFNLFFDHTANNDLIWVYHFEWYWLEIYNETTGEWEHLPNPDPIGNPSYTKYWVYPNQMNYNVPYQGNFRIVKEYIIWDNGNEGVTTSCIETIYEFEFAGIPKINGVTYFPCPDGGNELFVDASGVAPLLYEITEKEGQPFYINNGHSNVFTNLEQGTYNFRVTDDCGNIVNGVYEVGQPFNFNISATAFCDNELGSLSVTNFYFLEYQWWEGSNPNEILSTSHQLVFDPFSSAEDTGVYYLSITYTANPDSCVNQVLEYEINLGLPNAGEDETVIYCLTEQEYIDLFSVFTSEYDSFGVWEDLSQTGELQGSILAIGNLLPGTYEFGYTVDACEGSDNSVITIILAEIPDSPVISLVDPVCEGADLQLFVENASSQYTYIWTSPTGGIYIGAEAQFPSVELADAGNYTVVAYLGDCMSDPATVPVVVNPLPDFYITGDTMICSGQSTIFSVMGTNFNDSEADFVWYFNDVLIEGVSTSAIEAFEVGDYRVEVMLDDCMSFQVVTVVENDDMPAVVLKGVCVGVDFIISVVNTEDFPNAVYSWTGPGNFSGFDTFVNASGQPLGEYTVEITDQDGCVVSAGINVQSVYCQIPKGVSPNGDGLNDNFDLSNFDVENLKIFNRYGMTVYEAGNGYTNEWYGQTSVNNSNKLLPAATYYYVITFDGGDVKTGWVYLTRQE